MPDPLNLLILEDRPEDAELLLLELRRSGFQPTWRRVDTRSDYMAGLHSELDLILADYSLPQFDALQALKMLQELGLDVPFIVVTGGYEDLAIECMKRGAADYLIKDRLGRLGLAVRQALHEKQLREEKRLAQERAMRQERMAAVGQLVAGIAPNFGNLLSSIILHSEMVLGSLELSRRDEDRIRTILQQAERGAFLTRQILDFGRQSALDRVPVDVGQFMAELETALRPALPDAIQLSVAVPPGAGGLNADPSRLQQALINLAQNAQEAMPDGGELRLEIDRLLLGPEDRPPLRELPPGSWIRIRVLDHGTGISEQNLPHIFEPFFTTKRGDKRDGLGLSQAVGIVMQHGGHIGVQTVEGQGTEFSVYLPAAEADMRQLQPARPAREAAGPEGAILVVDDDRPTREAIAEMLASLHYRTLLAEDGERALQLLGDPPEPICLVLTDLVMPKVGGAELLQRLRAMGLEVPLVLMTSYPLGSEVGELLADAGPGGEQLGPGRPNREHAGQVQSVPGRPNREHTDQVQAGPGRMGRELVGWIEKPLTEASLVRALRAVLPAGERR